MLFLVNVKTLKREHPTSPLAPCQQWNLTKREKLESLTNHSHFFMMLKRDGCSCHIPEHFSKTILLKISEICILGRINFRIHENSLFIKPIVFFKIHLIRLCNISPGNPQIKRKMSGWGLSHASLFHFGGNAFQAHQHGMPKEPLHQTICCIVTQQ